MIIVLTFAAFLAALVVPNISPPGGGHKIFVTETIAQVAGLLDMYKDDVGAFPSSDQGLQALIDKPADAMNWAGPYLRGKTVPRDPWNKPLIYRIPSSRARHDYDLCSSGPPAPSGATAEICNK
jgi:general secretion pathway protein G